MLCRSMRYEDRVPIKSSLVLLFAILSYSESLLIPGTCTWYQFWTVLEYAGFFSGLRETPIFQDGSRMYNSVETSAK